MELAGRYAYAGREWVARKVVSILNAEEQELVHNHHNFAWKEQHEGEELVVVRKGALIRSRNLLIPVNRESRREIVRKVQVVDYRTSLTMLALSNSF